MQKLDQLLYYASLNWKLIPLHWQWPKPVPCTCGQTNCSSIGKHPLTPHGVKDATNDPAQIRSWHKSTPDANWGIRTGSLDSGGSGIVVVDIDTKNNGFDSWEALIGNYPDRFETITVHTGNRGLHYWFECPPGEIIGNSAGRLGPGLDIRGNDGYVILPPSITTHPYTFELPPETTPLAPLPDWLLEEIRSTRVTAPLPIDTGDSIPQGRRHDFLLSCGVTGRLNGFHASQLMVFLYALRDSICEPGDHPVTDKEIDDIVTYVSSKITPYHCTDAGNADRFYDQHKDDLLYCFRRKVWIVWDGKRWVIDYFDEVREKARATLRSIHHEAALLDDEKARKLVQKHAYTSESASKEEAMLKKSQTLFRLKDIEFDQQPDLINALNGTIHLPSGELLPHDRGHYLTRMVDIDYKPGAPCPKWEAFLEMVTQGNKELARQLQKYIGYTLTGNPDEQVMFFLYGTGANGKSTFIETLQRVIEEFAVRINIDHLLESRNPNTNPRQEILEMRGARMVVTSEVPSNHRLNESLVKDLTGGDTISARGVYQKKYERFKPTHKIWMVGNHKPKIYGEDEGILRRIILIPFEYIFPEEERRRMSEVLAEFEAEEEGILAWIVEGARLYYEEGLGQVEAIKQATRLYREDLDVVGTFLEECCLTWKDYTVHKDRLYQAWRDWCQANGEFDSLKRTKKWLTYRMLDKGYTIYGSGNSFLKGLKLRSSR